MPTPLFDSKNHRYSTADGTRLISVTGALKSAGCIESQWYSPEAAWRGSVVHRVAELADLGTLDEASVDPGAAGYLAGWRAFRANNRVDWLAVEEPRYHATLFYAGTPDRVAQGLVVDIKTGAPQRWHALQLAAYANLLAIGEVYDRLAVYLDGEGGYTVREYPWREMSRDFAVFCSALNVARWKK